MNEIFVEEENTVYELDPECLKRKEEQKKQEEQRKDHHRIQKMSRSENQNTLWVLLFILFVAYK